MSEITIRPSRLRTFDAECPLVHTGRGGVGLIASLRTAAEAAFVDAGVHV